jgi:hypothetical protein
MTGDAYTLMGFVLAEGLDVLVLIDIAAGGNFPSDNRQFVLYEDNFSWMDVWGLNPERLGSH